MYDIISSALAKGGKLYASVSGGKDGQAMVKTLLANGFSIEKLVHADLGRIEWPESLTLCQKLSNWHNIPLDVVRRSDNRELVDHWISRMLQLMMKGNTKPFWSDKKNRYCTSDLKRDPINRYFTSCAGDLIISCEGIRAEESPDRSKKNPLSVRKSKSSTYYKGMDAQEAVLNYRPGKRLTLDWYPIFNMTVQEVWATYGMSIDILAQARLHYKKTGSVPKYWNFHPAYVYGNDRVSCVFCIMGSLNDLKTGAKHHPELLSELIGLEQQSGYTFKKSFSLQQLL